MAKRTRHKWQADAPDEDDAQPSRPSRSEKKRQAERLTALGVRLTELTAKALAKLEMDDELREAIGECRALRRGNARARQQRLIGKLLRERDCDPLLAALEKLTHDAHAREAVARVRRERSQPEAKASTGQPAGQPPDQSSEAAPEPPPDQAPK